MPQTIPTAKQQSRSFYIILKRQKWKISPLLFTPNQHRGDHHPKYQMFLDDVLPSGKAATKNYGNIHHVEWVNQLFLWPCSIANSNKLPEGKQAGSFMLSSSWWPDLTPWIPINMVSIIWYHWEWYELFISNAGWWFQPLWKIWKSVLPLCSWVLRQPCRGPAISLSLSPFV